MCVVLDSNKIGDFLKPKPDMKPIHNWLENKNGKLVYSNHPKIEKEIKSHRGMFSFLREKRRSGRAKMVERELVEEEITTIKAKANKQRYKLKSNDIHIVALAEVSATKLLCSKDKNLHKDFKKVIDGGHIYQKKNHEKLLTADICP